MSNEPLQPHSTRRSGNGTLMVYLLCTVISATVTAFSAMMMALGSGLASSPDEPVPTAAMVLWGIGGLSFLPCTVLLVLLTGTHRRAIAIALALVVITTGMLTALGWFINSGGDMPGTTLGNAIVVLVVAVPLIAGTLMLWKSRPSG